jgi:hypothetical protein
MNELLQLLKQLPKPYQAWLAIEQELLNDNEASRSLGSIELLSGAIMETIYEDKRNDLLAVVNDLATAAWNYYETNYKGSPGYFNHHRLGLRSSFKGLLS